MKPLEPQIHDPVLSTDEATPPPFARGTRPDDPCLAAELDRVVAGDSLARAWLYDTFSAPLFKRLRARYASSPGIDPEELLHDLFIACFQHEARVLVRFRDRSPADQRTHLRLEIYLWGVACGLASNRRRSWRRKRAIAIDDIEPTLSTDDEEAHRLDDDVLTRMALCLRRASSRVYLYYKLRFVDGFTPDEVARATGWSRRATYKLKHHLDEALERCRRRLRLGGDAS